MALTSLASTSWSTVAGGTFNGNVAAGDPTILNDGTIWRLFYTDGIELADGTHPVIAGAVSTDGLTWTQIGGNLSAGTVVSGNSAGTANVEGASIFKAGSTYVLLYSGYANTAGAMSGFPAALYAAVSTDGANFTVVDGGPVLAPTPGWYDNDAVYSPTVIAFDAGYLMLYCGHAYTDATMIGGEFGVRLLAATSDDGMTWTKRDEPVLVADSSRSWMADGVAEPSLIQGPDGKWYLFFTGLHGDDRVIGIAVADNPLGPWDVAPEPIVSAASLGLPSGSRVVGPEAEFSGGVLRLWFTTVSQDGLHSIVYAEADWGAATGTVGTFVPHWLGTELNDSIQGTAAADSITAGAGNDWMAAEGGDDTVDAGDGADLINGQSGNDLLLGGSGVDTIDAGDGADTVRAGNHGDYVWGGLGSDSLLGEAGDDSLFGGAGLDTLDGGAGADFLAGDSGADILRGDIGDDVLLGAEGADLLLGANGFDVLDGGADDDTLDGGADDDQLGGGSGNDLLRAGTGNDVADAGDGNDTVDGGTGNDVIWGGDGADRLLGNAGNDILHGGAGANTLYGDDGDDVLSGGSDADILLGGAGADYLVGGADADRLDGGGDADILQGDDGNDTLAGGAGADVLVGGTGVDVADYLWSKGVTIALDGSVTATGDAAGDILDGVENLIGSATGSDRLVGDAGANRLEGRGGNDTLIGGAGSDTMLGGFGDDLYIVDSATDRIVEGVNAGTDLVRTSVSFALGANLEKIAVAAGTVAGLTLTGNALDNVLYGGTGSDRQNGGLGNDTLSGGAGNDTLAGGAGSDVLMGGAGNDAFVFNTTPNGATNLDRISGFSTTDDIIHLENAVFLGLSPGTGSLSSAAFHAGAGVTAAHDADDRIVYNATTGELFYDADGAGGVASIRFAVIEDRAVLTASDFLIV
ncbi:hypothetical protein KPL78_01390 [Roseomonas sp. HJA6]|uniref:Calcium-binding protein n=1 Tax=Roseomonas alba TaxID=2846776 RepID=A0ABS7A2H3_9PROT|nr:hypothetical protein [Neoroseomonas alba]MBW6396475.1 hypothetical protein [Neoroseomonas alba]